MKWGIGFVSLMIGIAFSSVSLATNGSGRFRSFLDTLPFASLFLESPTVVQADFLDDSSLVLIYLDGLGEEQILVVPGSQPEAIEAILDLVDSQSSGNLENI